MTEDERFGWYHRLSGHEFEQTPGEMKDWAAGVLQSKGLRVGHDLVTE